MSQVLAAAFLALCEMADATMAPIFPKLSTIARKILGTDHYTDLGDNHYTNPSDVSTGGRGPRAGGCTTSKASARCNGQNRSISNAGQAQGTSNLWRVIIPDDLRHIRLDQEDAARSRTNIAKTRPTPKAPPEPTTSRSQRTDRPGSPQRPPSQQPAPQPSLPDRLHSDWVDPPDGGPITHCRRCDGTGHAADLAPRTHGQHWRSYSRPPWPSAPPTA